MEVVAAKCPCPQAVPSDCSLPNISAVLGCKDVNITYLLMPPIIYIPEVGELLVNLNHSCIKQWMWSVLKCSS